jgi:hypothetical protein
MPGVDHLHHKRWRLVFVGSVGLFAVLPTIWICIIVVRWKHFSQRVHDSAAGTYRPFIMTPKFLYDRYKPDPVTFPHNLLFVVVTAYSVRAHFG